MLVCRVQGAMEFAQELDVCHHKEVTPCKTVPSVLVIHKSLWSQPFPSADHRVLCACLFQNTAFSRYCWLINIELTANGTVNHAWIKLTSQHVFLSINHIPVFLHLETRDSTSALCLGAILNHEITKKKKKKSKNVALIDWEKDTWHYESRKKQSTGFALLEISAGNVWIG